MWGSLCTHHTACFQIEIYGFLFSDTSAFDILMHTTTRSESIEKESEQCLVFPVEMAENLMRHRTCAAVRTAASLLHVALQQQHDGRVALRRLLELLQ